MKIFMEEGTVEHIEPLHSSFFQRFVRCFFILLAALAALYAFIPILESI